MRLAKCTTCACKLVMFISEERLSMLLNCYRSSRLKYFTCILFDILKKQQLHLLFSWKSVKRGCSGAETRENGFPTPFSRFALKRVWGCFKMAFFILSHTFSASTTSLRSGIWIYCMQGTYNALPYITSLLVSGRFCVCATQICTGRIWVALIK